MVRTLSLLYNAIFSYRAYATTYYKNTAFHQLAIGEMEGWLAEPGMSTR